MVSSSLASARKPRSRSTDASAVMMRDSRSTTRSVTSSAVTDWLHTDPSPPRRARAVWNWSGGTLKVRVDDVSEVEVVSWPNRRPPSPSIVPSASAEAAWTSSTPTVMEARKTILRPVSTGWRALVSCPAPSADPVERASAGASSSASTTTAGVSSPTSMASSASSVASSPEVSTNSASKATVSALSSAVLSSPPAMPQAPSSSANTQINRTGVGIRFSMTRQTTGRSHRFPASPIRHERHLDVVSGVS